mgnify:FL=1
MRRSEGFPSHTIWIPGAAKPKPVKVMSKKRKQEVERLKKIELYEKALKEEAAEKRERELKQKRKIK